MQLQRSDISPMLEVAVVAARLAGQKAMEKIKYTKAHKKTDDEIATDADAMCQRLIIDRIKETYPDHGFISEEGPDNQMLRQPPRIADPIWWVIDPIDGTNNYANGMLCFTISIAAMQAGSPIVAAIFEPATDSMFTAATDTDAQLNASRINVDNKDISRFESFGIDSNYQPEHAHAITQIMRQTRFRNLGSTALHLAYVAKGAMLGTATSTARLWDIAAGILIIQTAVGIVTTLTGEDILPIDIENYNGGHIDILAANKKTHPKFLEIFKT